VRKILYVIPEVQAARRIAGQGRPVIMLLSEGQMSDYKGAALMLDALPSAKQ
jgi:hypothetical protein